MFERELELMQWKNWIFL